MSTWLRRFLLAWCVLGWVGAVYGALIITTPTASKTFPSGSVLQVTPTFSGGEVTTLTLELTYKGKAYRGEAKTLGQLYAFITTLP